MSKLIYDDDEELFECMCGGFHYLKVYRNEYNGTYDYWIIFIERPKTLKQRWNALKSAFTGQTIYDGEITLRDVARLRKVLTPAPKPSNTQGEEPND
jgi:hypothetical protein